MKTIEQAATNAYSIEVLSSGCNAGVTFGKEMFKHGVEFAQKWIPIEKYLPVQNESDYQILVEIKDSKYCQYEVITIPFAGSDFDFGRFSRLYTQWRPISFL